MMIAGFAFAVFQQSVDPMNLPIGLKGSVAARIDQITNCTNGKSVSLDEVVKAAEGRRFVFVGEEHDNPDAHRWQESVIEALHQAGRDVVIGLEMYQRPKQAYLDNWILKRYSEEQFLTESDWKGQWGLPFELYQPIFDYAKQNGIRIAALNVPRDWVRIVSRTGFDSLPDDVKAQLPKLYLDDADHKKIFQALIGEGHPGGSMDAMYRGQVLWDEAMADSALAYFEHRYTTPRTVMVILAGNGHVMYRRGINFRIKRRTGEDGVTLVTVSIKKPESHTMVSAGIADFVIGIHQTAQH